MPLATVILALPDARSAVGVKMAVLVIPVPERAPSVPPAVTISPAINVVPGSSLKVKVIVAVSPTLTALLSLLIVSVGATVSMAIDGVIPAPPLFPAASV